MVTTNANSDPNQFRRKGFFLKKRNYNLYPLFMLFLRHILKASQTELVVYFFSERQNIISFTNNFIRFLLGATE